MKSRLLLITCLAAFSAFSAFGQSPCNNQTSITHEGYEYDIVEIGDQCWFAENCRYLPSVSPGSSSSETNPYYYVLNYVGTDVGAAQATANYGTYGVLYNWPAVMTEGICPSGWHIPSDEEFTQLTDFLGEDAGYEMKSTTGWNDGTNGSNSSGFTGLPSGYCYPGGCNTTGKKGYWWSASESGHQSGSQSMIRILDSRFNHVNRPDENRVLGFSARCLQD